MEAKQISKAVIKRLPRYYRYLGELMEDNVERISSNDLSKKMRVTASQISTGLRIISADLVSRDTVIMLNIYIQRSVRSWVWIRHIQ